MKHKYAFKAVAGAVSYRSTLDLSDARVDREKNIIRGVSLVTEGEARGHKQFADHTTLEQVRDCVKGYTGGLRVKFNPSTFDHGVGALAGRLPGESLRIKGKQLIGDLHIYNTYADKEYLYEMAETSPDLFGLSIEFNGVPEEKDSMRYARCDEIFAATIVDIPAANATGLFSRAAGENENEDDNDMKPEEVKKLIEDGLKPVTDVLTKLKAKLETSSAGEPSEEELEAAGVKDGDSAEDRNTKVTAFRQKMNKAATLGDVLQIFRMTGGAPARSNAGSEDEEKGEKGKVTSFRLKVKKYEEAGMKPGIALRRAANDDPEGYNKFVADEQKSAGAPTENESGGQKRKAKK